MARNSDIKTIFEIADDSLQGLLGYSFYTYAAHHVSQAIPNEQIKKLLPKTIPLTHEWIRFYDPDELITSVRKVNPDFLGRVCVVAMVSTFEVALAEFVECLENLGHPAGIKKPAKYKALQNWAFTKVANSDFGNQAMQARIPDLCVEVEHGRRIRNLFMHSQGFFDSTYESDLVKIMGRTNKLHPEYQKWKTNPNQRVLYPLKYMDYLESSKSHIQLLHCLHYEIQKQEFGDKSGYDYRQEKKGIIWRRLVSPY